MITTMMAAAALAAACTSHRELDFWLGTWEVRDGNEVVATSTIEVASDGCAIRESLPPEGRLQRHEPHVPRPGAEESGARRGWIRAAPWVNSRGEVTEGKLQFTGETHTAEGLKVLRRMSLAPEGRNVRQVSFASRDGTTWKPHYELLYSKP